MGTTLTGQIVAETYDSLLKVTDNNVITGTKKRITDGFGNDTPLLLSSTDVQIDGNLLLPGTISQYVRGDGSFATFTDVGLTSVGITLGSTGTDANVSGSPLTANGAITLNLPTASATNRGLLSSTDWTTFNNKVATTRTISTTAPLAGGGSLAANRTLSITQSTTTTDGYLSATDWNTFNNKVSTSRTLTINGTTFDLSANRSWTIADTGLTSVGISMPTAFSVSNSPLTANGTIAITGAGTAAQYIDGTGSLQTFPTFLSADKLITEVYNSSGATLTKGTIVYINGTQGNLPTIAKALATGDSTSAQTFGFVQTDITNMNNGYVIVAGKLSDLDTSAYTGGTQLYLSPTTAGTYTSTKPYAPNHLVYAGIVVRAHPTQGIIEVKIQNGYELDEIHDVSAQTPSNNDGIFYNSTTTLWENKSIATALGYTPLSGSGTTNTLPKFTGTSALGNSNITDSGTLITLGSGTRINGGVGFNVAPSANIGFRISTAMTGGTSAIGLLYDGVIQSDATATNGYIRVASNTAVASFTSTNINLFQAGQGTFGAGSVVTNQNGFIVTSTLIGATNNFGFRGQIDAGTGRWNLYMDGTANNYLAGSLGIGSTALTDSALRISKTITGSTTASGIQISAAIQSDVTSSAIMFQSTPSQAAGGTLTTLYHFSASQSTLSGSVTNQIGYQVFASVSGATNNRAFQGQIAAATNNYNLYMSGTAANYLAGNLGIGTTSPSAKLNVSGDIHIGDYGSASSRVLDFRTNNSVFTIATDGTSGGLGTTFTYSWANGGQGPLKFNNGSGEVMRLSATGNVGIGTSSPSTKLNVVGHIRAEGTDSDLYYYEGTRVGTATTYRVYDNATNIYLDGYRSIVLRANQLGGSGGGIFLNGGNVLVGLGSDNSTTAKLQVGGGISYQNIFNTQTASYTLALTDQSKIVETNVGSANNVTIPLDSSVNFPIGTEIQVLQLGAGQTTIVATSGVTTRSKSNQLKIANQNTGVTLVKRAANDWYVIGNVSA